MDYTNTTINKTHQFTSGLIKDLNELFMDEKSWTHARNMTNITTDGDIGTLTEESANYRILTSKYNHIIGVINVHETVWAIFSTNNSMSEIGTFDTNTNTYTQIINSTCLNFNYNNLIVGTARKNYDCTYTLYWDDGLNPSRKLNINNPPFEVLKHLKSGNCITTVYKNEIDCDALRLLEYVDVPIISLSKGISAGQLINGTYQVFVAYAQNNIRVTDYLAVSNPMSVFNHENARSSLTLSLSNLDNDYKQIEVAIVCTYNQIPQTWRLGFYSTHTKSISISHIDPKSVSIPLSSLFVQTPEYEKSEAMWLANNRLLRTGVYTRPNFNYQPLANKININWVAVQVPVDYYKKSNEHISYLADENYIFYIRWVYKTGKKSANYLIPGRLPKADEIQNYTTSDSIELYNEEKIIPKKYQVVNTASILNTTKVKLDYGTQIMEGSMGYAQIDDKFPNDKPEVWGDYCGHNITLHKFPDRKKVPLLSEDGKYINILGIKLTNIQTPVDLDGKVITDIVGFEVLRGNRKGNETIVSKGIFRNTGEYTVNNEKVYYQNYPYNDLRKDPFLCVSLPKGQNKNEKEIGKFNRNIFTFHGPNTQFKDPYLNVTECKFDANISGSVTGNFNIPHKHPKTKLLADFALWTAGAVGVGLGLLAIKGKKTIKSTNGEGAGKIVDQNTFNGVSSVLTGAAGIISGIGGSVVMGAITSAIGGPLAGLLGSKFGGFFKGLFGGGTKTEVYQEGGQAQEFPSAVKTAGASMLMTYFIGESMNTGLEMLQKLIPYKQFARQYDSHVLLNKWHKVEEGHTRRGISTASYIGDAVTSFDSVKVNNHIRNRAVWLKTTFDVQDPNVIDETRVTISKKGIGDKPDTPINNNASFYYGALKISNPNQYGLGNSVSQILIGNINLVKPDKTKKYVSEVIFGGDTYISRYTEMNKTPFFNEWLYDTPNEFEFDYSTHINLPYPRYWMSTEKLDVSNIVKPFVKIANSAMTGATVGKLVGSLLDNPQLGSVVGESAGTIISVMAFRKQIKTDNYNLDNYKTSSLSMGINDAYFYTSVNGVVDFYVESEYNLWHRDYKSENQRFYDPYNYTSVKDLFRQDKLRFPELFTYDDSLVVSNLLNNYISNGFVLPDDYDPTVEKSCYSYYPWMCIYSLPQQKEFKKDQWSHFLINNKKEFDAQPTCIKELSGGAVLFYFDTCSPRMWRGPQELRTDQGVAITLGDGSFLNNELQPVSSSETEFEYGSNQSRFGVKSTPFGVFHMSTNSGKVFCYGGSLTEISANGLSQWFSKYLPYKLIKQFPDYDIRDNMVNGIGVNVGYDVALGLVYFSKKDYELKQEYKNVKYLGDNMFQIDRLTKVKLGNPTYFTDASWTISYDPKSKIWVSYHDWIPEFIVSTRDNIITTKGDGLWKHNNRVDLFHTYYDIEYPCEVEFIINSGDITVLDNVEYIVEGYKYYNQGRDKFHVIDQNFDTAVIYNSEQCTGNLKLLIKPKNNPIIDINTNFQYDGSGFPVFYSNKENKVRFNKFSDIIRNRGEYDKYDYQPLWLHDASGYKKELNLLALDNAKNILQRKKIRHRTNFVLLKKLKSTNIRLILKMFNTKNTISFR